MDEAQLQEIKDAKKKILEGSLTIWNHRLDALAVAGNLKDILDHLGTTAETTTDTVCGCNTQCHCPPPARDCGVCGDPLSQDQGDPAWLGNKIVENMKQLSNEIINCVKETAQGKTIVK